MSSEVATRLIRAGSSLMAMVLIWLLVQKALSVGIDGVLFFIGVAAIAGLGGYEMRWAIEAIKSKSSEKESGKK